jgi:voltage-gated potassium channel
VSDILGREIEPSEDELEYDTTRTRFQRWSLRIGFATSLLTGVVLLSGTLIVVATGGKVPFLEALYFSLITVSTVGFSELEAVQAVPLARLVVVGTIMAGVAILVLFQSTLTAFFIEGAFGSAVHRRKMDKMVNKVKDHYILVGCGRVGRYAAEELMRTHHPLVVIERNMDAIHHLSHLLGVDVPYIEGDAADDEVLRRAGIERAVGLISALSLDRDNLFVTLSARTMNPNLRIISKVANVENAAKFVRAGASATISPQQIGGLRLASEVLRPGVTAFLDTMLKLPQGVRFHELPVSASSLLVGKKLRDCGLREMGLLVVGVRNSSGAFEYNPGPDFEIQPDSFLIVLGSMDAVRSAGASG